MCQVSTLIGLGPGGGKYAHVNISVGGNDHPFPPEIFEDEKHIKVFVKRQL